MQLLSLPAVPQRQEVTAKVEVPTNFGAFAALVVTASFTPQRKANDSIFFDHVIIQDPVGAQKTAWCRSWVAPAQGVRIFFVNEVGQFHARQASDLSSEQLQQ